VLHAGLFSGGAQVILRIVAAVVIGGAVGLGVGLVSRSLGGQCPLTCNPYVSTALGIVVALLLASRLGGIDAALKSPHVVRIDSEELYQQAVLEAEMPVLVTFYTQHCPACHRQLPVVDRLADGFAGRAVVAVLDAGAVGSVAGREGIDAVPTTLIFREGERVATMLGVTSEEELSEALEHLCRPAPAGEP